MGPSEKIPSAQRKIEWANEHIKHLKSLIGEFLASDFYSLGTKPIPEIGHVAYYVTRVEPLPKDVPLILGDAIHNLRSALDHLFWRLVSAADATADRQTIFPITKDKHGFDSAFGKREIAQIQAWNHEAVKLLREIQPYRTTDMTFWHLHQLDIDDKHKLIIPVATALDSWGLKRENIWLADLSGSFHIELGVELLRIPASTHAYSHDNIKFGTDVAFRNSEIAGGKSVRETLCEMADSVSATVEAFEPFFT